MNNQRLNIINGNRGERFPRLMDELRTQGIEDYMLWDGIYLPSIKQSINRSHKQIVEYARLAEWDDVCIAEDDIKFSHPNSYRYFLEKKPKYFDIYLSMVFLGYPDENGCVKDFTGLTMYIVKRRFYDTFLSVTDDEHLDKGLAGLGKYIVCDPFVASQYNGISSNTGKMEVYDDLLANREFYRG